MRKIALDDYATAGLILIGTAAIMTLVLIFTVRSDLASASVILCSAVFFLVGIFLSPCRTVTRSMQVSPVSLPWMPPSALPGTPQTLASLETGSWFPLTMPPTKQP